MQPEIGVSKPVDEMLYEHAGGVSDLRLLQVVKIPEGDFKELQRGQADRHHLVPHDLVQQLAGESPSAGVGVGLDPRSEHPGGARGRHTLEVHPLQHLHHGLQRLRTAVPLAGLQGAADHVPELLGDARKGLLRLGVEVQAVQLPTLRGRGRARVHILWLLLGLGARLRRAPGGAGRSGRSTFVVGEHLFFSNRLLLEASSGSPGHLSGLFWGLLEDHRLHCGDLGLLPKGELPKDPHCAS
mmetsp:Transcript_94223/g.224291  ORF Transcript_94223/g.224291 Transcript_94223/m.224291 type:complete len:241 (-) Transcript_94223:43-765(-)